MLKQYLHYKLSQKLSPQQIQLMKLIQLPTQAFEQRLKQELEENPALESGKDQEDIYDNEFDSNDNDMDNEQINADDINVDDYLSDDEIPGSVILTCFNCSKRWYLAFRSDKSISCFLSPTLGIVTLNSDPKFTSKGT